MNRPADFFRRLNRPQKVGLQLVTDCLLIVACFIAAMALRLESFAFFGDVRVWLQLALVLPITLVAFSSLGLYRAIIRYITGKALGAVAIGVLISALVMSMSSMVLDAPVPRSVPAIYGLLLFFTIGGVRFLVRSLYRRPVNRHRKPVIVYGAGDAGRQLVNALFQMREYLPVALIDDDARLHNMTIGDLRVHGPEAIGSIIDKTGARDILLALPSASRKRRREIIASLAGYKLEVQTIPGMSDIVSGKAELSEFRTVTPEDLLGRDPVAPRDDLLSKNIAGKVVLVSGAGGSIGSELCRQILELDPAALILFEMSEFGLYAIESELRETLERLGKTMPLYPILGSVQHPKRITNVLKAFRVQTVYHAAAYKHVPLVEENVVEGIRNNVFGTFTIATAAHDTGVENFILISTDKAVRPTNIMGASKRMAELICQAKARKSTSTRFSMVRFGNVLGSSGSVIPRFKAQIEKGGPVTVTHRDITRFFMTIPEAAQLVIQAGAMARGGDVFVLDMGEPVKILDLAKSMVRLHGLIPYVVDSVDEIDSARGDIPIRITGLRKGEKLYEELLIGKDPAGTQHSRIMTASEVSLECDILKPMLDRLMKACESFDVQGIRNIFLEAPLAYSPTSAEISDLMWRSTQPMQNQNLRVIEGSKNSETRFPKLTP